MMKKRLLFVCFFVSVFAATGIGQTSVWLENGSGIVLGYYSTVQLAYNAIPSTLTHPYVISIDSGYDPNQEKFPITFITKVGASAVNTITLTVANNVNNFSTGIDGDTDSGNVFLFDNADWIIFDGKNRLQIASVSYIPVGSLIAFINGSSHNTISGCYLLNFNWGGAFVPSDTTATVFFGQSADPGGNSYNTIQNCTFDQGANNLISKGTANHPNTHLRIVGNSFATSYNCIHAEAGTGYVEIDSNRLFLTANYAPLSGIFFDPLADTAIITRNYITWLSGSSNDIFVANDTPAIGVLIHPADLGNGYALIANNMIENQDWMGYSQTRTGMDIHELSTHVVGIEFNGSGPANADIYHNTILIQGYVGGTGVAGQIGSAALNIADTNTLSAYNIRNNIFMNHRMWGIAGLQHPAVSFPDQYLPGLSLDYNTYDYANRQMAKIGNTVYASLSDYQLAMAATHNESHSDTANVQFTAYSDLHLASSMIGNAKLKGVAVPAITNDLDGDLRGFPYRGADEYVATCSGTPQALHIYTTLDTLCPGTPLLIVTDGISSQNGVVNRWQTRPLGTSVNFTDIANPLGDRLFMPVSAPTEFRLLDSCTASGLTNVSNILYIYTPPIASAVGFTVTHVDLTYTFFPNGMQNITWYHWYFGDSTTDFSHQQPTHHYNNYGLYNVTLVVGNGDCGYYMDTIVELIQVEVGVNNITSDTRMDISPNPSKGIFTLQVPAYQKDDNLTVTTVTGNVIRQVPVTSLETALDLRDQPSGMYFVHLNSSRGNAVKKVVVCR